MKTTNPAFPAGFTRILQAAAAESGVSPADLTGPRRFDYLCIARYFAIGLASELTKIPTHDLGHALNRSNTMIRRSIKICNELCIADTRIARRYENLRRTINLGNLNNLVISDEVLRRRADSLRMDFLESLVGRHEMTPCRKSRKNPEGLRKNILETNIHTNHEVLITIRNANGDALLSACRPTWREAVDVAMANMAKIGGGK